VIEHTAMKKREEYLKEQEEEALRYKNKSIDSD